ncbi:unnamed protein product [Eruca vesicaria subsp. sativa]|uniref:Uncharacterized protein n=1 Tax=Eruca vesicaria subsp. sativa TaxID=29727 RepID=A0ABC8LW21_ERUVS|nr:unnamed protein product [Eruca vesicaria subsp. sativa]
MAFSDAVVPQTTFDVLRLGRSSQFIVARLIRFLGFKKQGEFMGIKEKYYKLCANQVIRSLGKLERSTLLKALCSKLHETTELPICLTEDIETNECLQINGGCWENKTTNITACMDDHSKGCKCPPGLKGDVLKNCKGIT